MLNLLQHELDDVKAALKDWCYYEFCDDAPYIPSFVHRAMLREAVDRIYEVCQTAHARELRKSSAASTNSLDNDSALT